MTLMITTHRVPEPSVAIAIEPQGEIRSDNAHLLRERVTAVLAATRPQRIVVDLTAVPSIDEAGLRVLRAAYNEAAAHNARLAVLDPKPQVLEQLRRHGLAALLNQSIPV